MTNQERKAENHSSPPYLLGLLGFIPMIGFFVGMGLTLYGYFKYKNNKLIIIGIACMMFTVAVYSSLYHFGFKSDLLKGKNSNLLWLTADANKIPVFAKFKIPVGNGELKIISATGLKN